MSFIWLLCKVCLAIEGYNIIVDYIVTKTVLNDIKKDYDKLYSKYKDKYDSYKLKSYLKGKLYQKGYTIDEINKVIDE